MIRVTIDGRQLEAQPDELLIDLIERSGVSVPHVCYHPQLGPIQTCDTCMVEVNGQSGARLRHCGLGWDSGHDQVRQGIRRAAWRPLIGFSAITCSTARSATTITATAPSTTPPNCSAIEHQSIPFQPKALRSRHYESLSTATIPDQCILCGRCVEACQNVEVNETLSINWEDPHPRVCGTAAQPIGESSCVSCGHCVTVCPCNALMEKSMLGHAGFLTATAESRLWKA